MHEFSITQKLIDLALQKANSRQILHVKLLIGPLSEEREESIRFYWRDLAKGSPGEGAELHFERAPIRFKCLDCSGTLYLGANGKDSLCTYCDRDHLQFLNGDEVRLESIEVE